MTYYLGLGTNLGDRAQHLADALRLLGERVGQVTACSSTYETAPWGFSSPHAFLNAACRVESLLTPEEVLQTTQQIERDMGRTHKSVEGRYEDRVIDIDMLRCMDAKGGEVCMETPVLCLPHPLIAQRDFVKRPLDEICPRK